MKIFGKIISLGMLLILTAVWSDLRAQCMNFTPPSVPFSTIDYITLANADGDRLIVGSLNPGYPDLIPLPNMANGRFCNMLELAPGYFADAYVPSMEERMGDYSGQWGTAGFDGLLLDPLDDNPFPGAIIPWDRLYGVWGWRIASMSLTFASMDQPGTTTVTISQSAPEPPQGFALGDPATYYNISTTALFSGQVTVCIDYSSVSYSNELNLGLFHYEDGQWIDITTTLDIDRNEICGSATSLSPFAIFEALELDTIYFPQIANGGGYTTIFTIFNPTSNAATGTLTLRDGEGNPLIFSMMNGSTDSQFDLSIPANGSVRLESSGTGNIETGWAVIESSADLQGVATFDYRPISVLLDSVGVVGSLGGNRFLMPIDISPSADEGLAIVNPGTSNVAIRLTLIDENGSTYAFLDDPQLNPLSAKKSLSLYATELFPSLQSGSFKGLLDIEVIGSGNIAVMGLSYKEGQISIIPVLASP